MDEHYDVAVIGAGVAGLTAAAFAASAGASVVVLEHHNVPGGCASFYQRDGFRFDVGATVVNGFGPRGVHRRIFDRLGVTLEAQPLDPAMVVHLPSATVKRYGDGRWKEERIRAFGPGAEAFWTRQERLADRAWDFAAGLPCLPVDVRSIAHLARIFRPHHFPLAALQGKTVADLIPERAPQSLRSFVDVQLLITAQSDAAHTDASFGVTALDIAREGTFHLPGGIADIAIALARSARHSGAKIRYNTTVTRIVPKSGSVTVEAGTERIFATNVVAAIPHENLIRLAGVHPNGERRKQRWSAVVAYAGTAAGAVPDDAILHHQVLMDDELPLGECNSAFVSISAPEDRTRARSGGRAITISTHTDPSIWERAYAAGTLQTLKVAYAARLREALDRAMGRQVPLHLFELATPHTFERYTARLRGLVGGIPQEPQTANLRARSHRTAWPNVLLCGDTAFPGQSTVGVSLSAINAVRALGVDVSV